MREIKSLIGNRNVYVSDELGHDSAFIESSAFGYISVRTFKKLPSPFLQQLVVKNKIFAEKFFILSYLFLK